jgi:hypothetical protein
LNGLERIGFLYPQRIIWNKGRTVLTRTLYWFHHEPCWFLRKKNAPWYGKAGENSTIWTRLPRSSPASGSGEEKFDHPTQKPIELMRKPIRNHTVPSEIVYVDVIMRRCAASEDAVPAIRRGSPSDFRLALLRPVTRISSIPAIHAIWKLVGRRMTVAETLRTKRAQSLWQAAVQA